MKRLGETRRLYYWLLLETGLRVNEVRTLCVGDVHLGTAPYIEVQAKNEKARRGAQLPLRDDLAQEMGRYLEDAQRDAQQHGRPIPMRIRSDERFLPEIPASVKVLNRDLYFAGIEKKDDAGRVLDVHALRHTYCTRLSKAGVSLQLGQRLMRHSTPSLTANYYTHLDLGDKRKGVDMLPALPTGDRVQAAQALENGSPQLAPTLAPESHKEVLLGAFPRT